LLAGVLLLAPEIITEPAAIGILAFLLGLKTIGNLIIDSHNKIHYHGKTTNKKTAAKKKK